MSHELEIINGQAQMAYVGEKPWHGLGVKLDEGVTPQQMMKAAGLNWGVVKAPQFIQLQSADGKTRYQETEQRALVRTSDNKILDYVSGDWNPVQNETAFEFFNDFVQAGEMMMDTAGSLHDGKVVWALAKVGESFDIFGGDVTENYLLFSNPHKFGQSIDIRMTPIRVVCNNTITMALGSKSTRMFRQTHRIEFDADKAKLAIGVAADKLAKYKEAAVMLGSKRAEEDQVIEFMSELFPVYSYKKDHVPTKTMSDNANRALDLIAKQPGANFREGSWWQAFCAVTYMVDHELGRSQDTRLSSAWFGTGADKKIQALNNAVKLADKSKDLIIA